MTRMSDSGRSDSIDISGCGMRKRAATTKSVLSSTWWSSARPVHARRRRTQGWAVRRAGISVPQRVKWIEPSLSITSFTHRDTHGYSLTHFTNGKTISTAKMAVSVRHNFAEDDKSNATAAHTQRCPIFAANCRPPK